MRNIHSDTPSSRASAWFMNWAPSAVTAPSASSGSMGTPTLRETSTSRSTPSERDTAAATATPPRGMPITSASCPRYEHRRSASCRPASRRSTNPWKPAGTSCAPEACGPYMRNNPRDSLRACDTRLECPPRYATLTRNGQLGMNPSGCRSWTGAHRVLGHRRALYWMASNTSVHGSGPPGAGCFTYSRGRWPVRLDSKHP